MRKIQDFYIKFFATTYKVTGRIPAKARDAIVTACLVLIMLIAYFNDILGARGILFFSVDSQSVIGTALIAAMVLLMIDGPLHRIEWKKHILYPYMAAALWMSLMSLDHYVGERYGLLAWTMLLIFPALWFVLDNIDYVKYLRKIAHINAILGGVYIIGCYLYAPVSIHTQRGGQYMGLNSHPNMFGMTLITIIASILYLVLSDEICKCKMIKPIYMLILGASLHLCWISAARSSILATLLVVVLAVTCIPRWGKGELKKKLVLFLLVIAIALVGALGSYALLESKMFVIRDYGFYYHYWNENVYSPLNYEVDDNDKEAVEEILNQKELNGSNATERFSMEGKSLTEYSSFRIPLWKFFLKYMHVRGNVANLNIEIVEGMVLRNPHNIILEISYRFGWPAGLCYLAFMLATILELIRAALKGKYKTALGITALFAVSYFGIGMLDIMTRTFERAPVVRFYLTYAAFLSGTILGQSKEDVARENKHMYMFVKRLVDLVCAGLATIVLSPLFVILSIVVKVDSKGPAFYSHKRVGKNGKLFNVYKFRTMIVGADNIAEMLSPEEAEIFYKEYKLDNDPRITKVGAWLRKTSLDELPQLINIIRGEMSIVGPRPLVEDEYKNYTAEDARKLKSSKPGLTGYWQAYARNSAGYEDGKRQEMELYYVDNASSWLDLKIIFKTVGTVITRRGAK